MELDLHSSRDGALVVFHDAMLECRTDGVGRPEDHDLATLRRLDVGYGYTADGGTTFPLRGTGIGVMPTLDEVLDRFDDQSLILHLKTNDPADGDRLVDALAARPSESWSRRIVYGGAKPLARLRARLPAIRTFDKTQLKACGLGYLATGWAGHVPESCRNSLILVPIDLAPLFWGWPRRFEARMAAVGTRVVLVGPMAASGWMSGVDTEELRGRVPEDFSGWVWTNRIEVMAQ